MTKTKRLCLWSVPLHPAHTLVLAFAQRNDTEVIDKPFHAHFLRRTGFMHPSREAILDSLDSRPDQVVKNLLQLKHKEILFINSMPHHMLGVNLDFLEDFSNIFLIRHPRLVIPSILPHLATPSHLEVAYRMQKELFAFLEKRGQSALVIDTSSLTRHPRKIMSLICRHSGIPFQENMMKWYLHKDIPMLDAGGAYLPEAGKNYEMNAFSGKFEELYEKCYEHYVDLLVHSSLPVEETPNMVA